LGLVLRLPKAAIAAKTVSTTKMTHKKAAKAVAASKTPHGPIPLPQKPSIVEPKKTARETKPANQKIMVTASRATVAKICWM